MAKTKKEPVPKEEYLDPDEIADQADVLRASGLFARAADLYTQAAALYLRDAGGVYSHVTAAVLDDAKECRQKAEESNGKTTQS